MPRRFPRLLLFALMALPVAWVLAHAVHMASLYWRNPESTAFMRQQAEALAAAKTLTAIRHRWVDYSRIPSHTKRAVIAAEDSRFVEHDGLDWDAIEQAAKANRDSGRIRRGGSTISMQLVKNLYLSPRQSYIRKGQELLLTPLLELLLPKRRILEIYLNVAEFGVGVFGIEAAAQHYYGIGASQLSPEQSAWLASILPAPRRFDRNRGSAFVQRKAESILTRMPQVAIP